MSPQPPKTALVIGVTGASGAHVAQLLLRRGYRVAGAPGWRGGDARMLDALGIRERIGEAGFRLDDPYSVARALRTLAPELIVSLADDHDAARSWAEPIAYGCAEVIGMSRLCAVLLGQSARVPMVHVIGGPEPGARPSSPAATAALFAAAMVQGYRAERGLPISLAVAPWLESPLSDAGSRLRSLARSLALAAAGDGHPLEITLGARCPEPISHADAAEAIWRAVTSGEPADYALAPTREVSMDAVVSQLARGLEIDLVWTREGSSGEALLAHDRRTGRGLVRASAGAGLVAIPPAGRPIPGWSPRTSLAELCRSAADAEAAPETAPLDVA